ncbi:MAG: tRNA (adenosine(37)-N6)-threonylcarbamoyltransferase complex ATPase subunit type 1 TsaE [Simkaniaceae bacterium]|nr:tRNA (adenosine(37)-N6)-threonylcarbamoyltransferase complex ATPase subunit type 1 TsaE [Simkaniaceae bacterium]
MSHVGLKRISKSPFDTLSIGREIGKRLPPHHTVCLYGDLGAGKTTLIKGIVEELTKTPAHEVNSPTFTYLNIYEGEVTIYHFDCYRLENSKDFLERGLEEYLDGLCLIEWPERISSLLPKNRSIININYQGKEERVITYEESSL